MTHVIHFNILIKNITTGSRLKQSSNPPTPPPPKPINYVSKFWFCKRPPPSPTSIQVTFTPKTETGLSQYATLNCFFLVDQAHCPQYFLREKMKISKVLSSLCLTAVYHPPTPHYSPYWWWWWFTKLGLSDTSLCTWEGQHCKSPLPCPHI